MTDELRDGIPETESPDEFEIVPVEEAGMKLDDYPDFAAEKAKRDKLIKIRHGVRDTQSR